MNSLSRLEKQKDTNTKSLLVLINFAAQCGDFKSFIRWAQKMLSVDVNVSFAQIVSNHTKNHTHTHTQNYNKIMAQPYGPISKLTIFVWNIYIHMYIRKRTCIVDVKYAIVLLLFDAIKEMNFFFFLELNVFEWVCVRVKLFFLISIILIKSACEWQKRKKE